MSRRKKFLLVLVFTSLAIGIFFIGRKFVWERENKQTEIQRLQEQLQQVEEQLQKETNPTKKQELEQKKKELEKQIQKLNNPRPPLPPTRHKFTVRYNTEVGNKHEYIDINDNKRRILIDKNHDRFNFTDAPFLTIKDNQYTISFDERESTKKGDNFVIEKVRSILKLNSITPIPETVKEVKQSGTMAYDFVFIHTPGQQYDNQNSENYLIPKDHPDIKRVIPLIEEDFSKNWEDRRIWKISFARAEKRGDKFFYFFPGNKLKIEEKK